MKYLKDRQVFESNVKFENTIPDVIWDLNDIFNEYGYKLYLVGGSVRDFIEGDEPKDFDLATDAKPDEIIDILKPSGFKLNLQGAKFGVVVVYHNSQPEGIEIATFRKDITKGRKPEVEVGVTIEDDVQRRDITFNSMFFDLQTKEIVDIVGGKKDLENKVVRMVGEPSKRIAEDKLRILRVFRFASRYDANIDEKTSKAIMDNNELDEVSAERIWEEFKKAFKQAKDFNIYLGYLDKYKMWEEVFPKVDINYPCTISDNISLMMAELFKYNNPKFLERRMVHEFKIPSLISGKVSFLIDFLTNFKVENVYTFYKRKKRSKASDNTIKRWLKMNNVEEDKYFKFLSYKPTVKGEDVMKELNVKGKEIGNEINRREVELFKKHLEK